MFASSAAMLSLLGICWSVSIVATDETGAPLPGARVELKQNGLPAKVGTTERNGVVRFFPVVVGPYEAQVYLEGFEGKTVSARQISRMSMPIPVELPILPAVANAYSQLFPAGPTTADFRTVVMAAAGPGAEDCGSAGVREGRKAAIACAEEALSTGRAFFVTFAVQGIDSQLLQALVSFSSGPPIQFWYDSDIGGGGGTPGLSRIEQRPCPYPRLSVEWNVPVHCPNRSDA
ncbi:MAG: carboxypeptidase-like regulatory domain-containing protein [Thermoanaerobaculia bacterium]